MLADSGNDGRKEAVVTAVADRGYSYPQITYDFSGAKPLKPTDE